MRTPLSGLAAALLALLVGMGLAGCGADPAAAPTRSAADGSTINDPDVAFVRALLRHDADGLLLLDATLGHEIAPEIAAEVERTREELLAEVELLTRWLEAWGEQVPETSRDHANAPHEHDDGEGHEDAPIDEPALLVDLTEHHERARDLLRGVLDDGHHPEVATYATTAADSRDDRLTALAGLG